MQRCNDATPAGNSALIDPTFHNYAALDYDAILNGDCNDVERTLVLTACEQLSRGR
jgi:hypothetical protein